MRKTSDVTDARFPFAEDRVALIAVLKSTPKEAVGTKEGRGFEHASTLQKKRSLVQFVMSFPESLTLLAVWPGKDRSDVFEVDDLDACFTALIEGEGCTCDETYDEGDHEPTCPQWRPATRTD